MAKLVRGKQEKLAEERTFLSYERTMLSYFSTAFAALLFGFALIKLSLTKPIIYIGGLSMIIGIVFLILGLYYSPLRKGVREHHTLK